MLPNYSTTYVWPFTDFQKLVQARTVLKIDTTPIAFDEVDKYRDINLSFTKKYEYLNWVAHWKNNYKALVEKQIELKKYIRQPHITTKVKDGGYWIINNPFASAQSEIAKNRDFLSVMIYLRHEGKKKSWKLRQESQ